MKKNAKQPKPPIKNTQDNPPKPTILRYKDCFDQYTYLRVPNNTTWEHIKELHKQAVAQYLLSPQAKAEQLDIAHRLFLLRQKKLSDPAYNDPNHELEIIEWAIQRQLLVLLTDEESRLYETAYADKPA